MKPYIFNTSARKRRTKIDRLAFLSVKKYRKDR
jgi:hypothetical protein